MSDAAHTERRDVPVGVGTLFDAIVDPDTPLKVMTGWGPIPAVADLTGMSGDWTAPGSRRTVVMTDGATAREEILAFARPQGFRYRVGELTGPLGRMVDHALGEFAFAGDEGASSFTWTYAFHARGPVGTVATRLLVATAWSRYMAAAADRLAALATGWGAARHP